MVLMQALSELTAAGESDLQAPAPVGVAVPAGLDREPVSPGSPAAGRPTRDDVRLFLTPTAKTLPSGSAYLGVYELFFPHVVAGKTDWLTLGGGITIFPLGVDQFVFVAPKLRLVSKPRFQGAIGGLWALFGLEVPLQSLYVVATGDWGAGSLTLGTVGSVREGGFPPGRPLFVLGRQVAPSTSMMFVAENYVDPVKGGFLPGLGIRFHGRACLGFWPFSSAPLRAGCTTSCPGSHSPTP